MSQVIYSLQITKGEQYLTSNFRFHQLLTVTDETNMPMIPKHMWEKNLAVEVE